MISYWYTLFYLYSKYGTPVIRAMSIEFPNDLCARDLNKQFMVGDSILVCSVYEENQEYVKVYLPDNRWFDYHTFIELNSGFIKYETSSNWIPTFIRGGTILPNRNIHRNCTKEMLGDPFALIVALDTNYEAYGSLYMDDTITHRYREGEFLFARIKLTDSTLTYKLENHLQITNQISSIKICGFKTTPNSVLLHCNDLTKLLDFEADCNSLTISNIPVLISEEWAIVFN